jgi:chemotaxis protein MotB
MARRHEGGHHGGAWKVAYADFVTAMMALFIVLWILGADEKSKAAVAAYFTHPSIFNGGPGKGFLTTEGVKEMEVAMRRIEEREAADSVAVLQGAMRELQQKGPVTQEELAERGILANSAKALESMLESNGALRQIKGQVAIEFTSQGLRIQLHEINNRPLFSLGSANPEPITVAFLTALAKLVDPLPNALLVEGHTDSRPYSGRSDYSNWELSNDRANAARRILEAGGLDPARVARVVGYADRCLLVPDEPSSEHNRRISITVCYRNARLD